MRFDSYPALLGVTIGNALGFDGQEIIARTGRESLSLILAVPRISLTSPIIEGRDFNIGTATIGSAKLSLGSSIEMKDKSKYYRTKVSKQSYLILTKYVAVPKKPGSAIISLKQNSKTTIKRVVNIATDGILESSINQVSLFDEDVIKIRGIEDIQSTIKSLRFTMRNNTAYFSSAFCGQIPIKIRVKGISKQSKKIKKTINLYITNAIKANVIRPRILRSSGSFEITVENLSRRQLIVQFKGEKGLSVESERKVLEPKTSDKFSVQYKITLSEFSKEMNLSLVLVYKGEIEHYLPLGIKAKVVNDEKIISLLKELKELKTSKEGQLKVLSEKTGLPESLIEELYSDLLEE